MFRKLRERARRHRRRHLERLIELTGNRALTGFTAPKLLWVRRHEPDVYARDSFELPRGLGLDPAARPAGRRRQSQRPVATHLASVLDLPLEVTATDDAAVFGAAPLAGVAAGVVADVPAAVDACVGVVGRVEPDPAWRDAYARGYEAFGRLYPVLAGLREARH